MRIIADPAGAYDLDQVVAITPGGPLSKKPNAENSATLHLSGGHVLRTQLPLSQALAAWSGAKSAEKA